MKGVDLQVEPVDATVKADRVLTLFMLNTLADNARKFTERGGCVSVSANVTNDYVEVSVKDTGCGLSEAALAHVFEHKVSDTGSRSHGFGLMNCKGIIEKYRKMSQLFNVCLISAESEKGRGSRFFFRLPKGIRRLIAILLLMTGLYVYAVPSTDGGRAAELLTIKHYNDSAVSALERHDWEQYRYYNKVYTRKFREMSADNTLTDYCRTMQQSQINKRIAMILLLVLLLLIVPAYYMLYYRHRLNERYKRERMQLDNIEMADDELHRSELEAAKLHVANNVLDNCLSALKHETMYYPDRIRQLVDNGDINALGEVTQYYRQLYGLLSEQAMRQVEQIRLHVHPMVLYGQQVMGDENMLRYLFEIIKPQEMLAEAKDEQYVSYTLKATFKSDIDSLLCRQILRDHGEATHRRGCGITIEDNKITIILPRYNGKI
jgi:hypothetical protein